MTAGSCAQTVLPFTGLTGPQGAATDAAGSVYVVDGGNNRVVKLHRRSHQRLRADKRCCRSPASTTFRLWRWTLPATSTSPTTTRATVTGWSSWRPVPTPNTTCRWTAATSRRGAWRSTPRAICTSSTTHSDRVLKVVPGAKTWTALPFSGIDPRGVAVDAAGDVFVTDLRNNRVVKLAAGSNTQTVLPFTGLQSPDGIAVDAAGNVYVADSSDPSGRQARGRVEHPNRPSVHRTDRAVHHQLARPGGGRRGQPLRRRRKQPEGAQACGRVEHRTVLPFAASAIRMRWQWMRQATCTSPTAPTIRW